MLGVVAVVVGMTLLSMFLQLNLDHRTATAVTAVIVLIWAFWPSKKKEQG